jgi:hypothetical protein
LLCAFLRAQIMIAFSMAGGESAKPQVQIHSNTVAVCSFFLDHHVRTRRPCSALCKRSADPYQRGN